MEENLTNSREDSLKKTMYVMIGVAVVMALVLAYVWYQKSSLVKELNIEKEALTEQMVTLQHEYATLSSDNEKINAQLDSSREEVSQLIERIKKTEATNRTMIRKYERELGTLRSIMRNYIAQIDSLNTLNHKLTADAAAARAAARKEAAETRKQSEELSKTVATLSDQVAAGSVLKGRALRMDAYNASDKITDRSSRVVRLMATLSLVENELAPKGPVRVYIRVKGPDGILLTGNDKHTFTFNGEPMMCSASREVDYQGEEVEMSIYLNGIEDYVKGIYTVEAYTDGNLLGSAELMLR